jgi:hypothetical protein
VTVDSTRFSGIINSYISLDASNSTRRLYHWRVVWYYCSVVPKFSHPTTFSRLGLLISRRADLDQLDELNPLREFQLKYNDYNAVRTE